MYWLLLLLFSICASQEDPFVCVDEQCFLKEFVPKPYWQEVRKGQNIPVGLDVKVNLNSGVISARELPGNMNATPPMNQIANVIGSEFEDDSSEYMFTKQFAEVRSLASSAAPDFTLIVKQLDDVVEYASGWAYGPQIISHELRLLERFIFDRLVPSEVRELSSRIIGACLRNNIGSAKGILNKDSRIVYKLLEEAVFLSHNQNAESEVKTLIKRFLTIIELLQQTYEQRLDANLLIELYEIDDHIIKLKVLSILCKTYRPDRREATLVARSLDPTIGTQLATLLSTHIQDERLDELQVREFFTTLRSLKKELGRQAKLDANFLNWLAKECEKRKQSLATRTEDRSEHDEEFDKMLIESRHLIFGNPMAHRIKNFEDHDEL